jgi:hypothetical protein
MSVAAQSAPAVQSQTQIAPTAIHTALPASTYIQTNGNVSRTVVLERYAVSSPRTVNVPRTHIESRVIPVQRSFQYGVVHNFMVPKTIQVPEVRMGSEEVKVTVPRTVFDDAEHTVTVPRVGLREQEIMVPKTIMVKQMIKVPYGYTTQHQVPIKVPRVIGEQHAVHVPRPYTVARPVTVHEARTTIIPRTQNYTEHHIQHVPRTVIDKHVVHDQQIVERPRVYEQEHARIVQSVIPGQARSFIGQPRAVALGGYGGYAAPFAPSGFRFF